MMMGEIGSYKNIRRMSFHTLIALECQGHCCSIPSARQCGSGQSVAPRWQSYTHRSGIITLGSGHMCKMEPCQEILCFDDGSLFWWRQFWSGLNFSRLRHWRCWSVKLTHWLNSRLSFVLPISTVKFGRFRKDHFRRFLLQGWRVKVKVELIIVSQLFLQQMTDQYSWWNGCLIMTIIFGGWTLWFSDFYESCPDPTQSFFPSLSFWFFFFQADRRIWRPLEPNLGPSPFPFANSKKKDILHNFSQMETYFWQICRSSTFSFCFWPRSPLHPKFSKLIPPSTPPQSSSSGPFAPNLMVSTVAIFKFFLDIIFTMYGHNHFSCDWRCDFLIRKIHFHNNSFACDFAKHPPPSLPPQPSTERWSGHSAGITPAIQWRIFEFSTYSIYFPSLISP